MDNEITKGQLVDQALKYLAMSGSLIQPSPSDKTDFLTFLEIMIASWTNAGLHIGYKLSEFGIEPDATEDSGVRISDASAVAMNLAIHGASSRGLLVDPQLSSGASIAYSNLFPVELIQRESNTNLYMGSGNSFDGYRFSDYQAEDDNLTVEKNGQVDDLTI
jgi:hypothetical protein